MSICVICAVTGGHAQASPLSGGDHLQMVCKRLYVDMDAVLSPDTSVGTKVAVVSCCCALARQYTFGPVQHRAGLQVPKLEVLKSSSHRCLQETLQKRYQQLSRSLDPTDEELVFFIENANLDDSAGNGSYNLRTYLLLGDKGRLSGTTSCKGFFHFPGLLAHALWLSERLVVVRSILCYNDLLLGSNAHGGV